MLRRFADARLLRNLAEATQLVLRLNGLLQQLTAEARTNYDLMQRWKSIAQQAQTDLAAERARAAAALAHDPMPGFPCDNPNCPCQRARTQETQP